MIPVLPLFFTNLTSEKYSTINIFYLSILIFLCCRYLYIKFVKYQEKESSQHKEKFTLEKINTNTSIKSISEVNEPKSIYEKATEIKKEKVISKAETFEVNSKTKPREPINVKIMARKKYLFLLSFGKILFAK